MNKGYQSILSKETLAYNLWYHLQEYGVPAEAQETIRDILKQFEVKNGD
jgi:hypothetical protein